MRVYWKNHNTTFPINHRFMCKTVCEMLYTIRNILRYFFILWIFPLFRALSFIERSSTARSEFIGKFSSCPQEYCDLWEKLDQTMIFLMYCTDSKNSFIIPEYAFKELWLKLLNCSTVFETCPSANLTVKVVISEKVLFLCHMSLTAL